MWLRNVLDFSSHFMIFSHLFLSIIHNYSNSVSYGPPWAHYLGGYQDRLLGGPLGLLGLCHTAPDGVGRKDYGGGVLK
jgi:hypothetical protein